MINTQVEVCVIASPDRAGGISAYISPRFLINNILDNYPDWRDWPAVINSAATNFTASVRNAVSGTYGARSITQTSAAPDSAIWRALFGDPSAIPSGKYNYMSRVGPTYLAWDGEAAAELLDTFYQTVANAHPIDPPTGNDISAASKNAIQQAGQAFRNSLIDTVGPPEDPLANWHADKVLAACGNHPELMRLLGLIVDFSIGGPLNYDAIVIELNGYENTTATHAATMVPIGMEVVPNASQLTPAPGAPTYYSLAGNGFLDFTDWGVTQLDYATTTRQVASWANNAKPDEADAVPSPSTSGITIVRKGDMGSSVLNMFQRHDALRGALVNYRLSGTNQLLFKAEDAIVGWRVDVRDITNDGPSGPWYSLFRRQTSGPNAYGFEFGSPTIAPVVDEGWTIISMLTRQKETQPQPNASDFGDPPPTWTANAQQRMTETLHTWDGWSGAAPPPGKVVSTATGAATTPDPNARQPGGPIQVEVDYRPEAGTLPQLRYGHEYQFRARAVDLCGNSVPLGTSANGDALSPIIRYGRTHPIPAPVPARQSAKPVPGTRENLATVVIKSELGQADATVATQTRILFPASATQQTCERHGVPGDGADPAAYADLAARDPLSVDAQTTDDPASGERTVALPNGGTGPHRPVANYLPDPAIKNLVVSGIPTDGGYASAPVGGNWPALAAWRIVVRAGSTPATVDPNPNVSLALSLPKATISPIEVSCGPLAASDFYISNGTNAAVNSAIGTGRQWMVSSRLDMVLVHAVRLPLSLPEPIPASLSAVRPDVDNPDFPANTLGSLVALVDVNTDVHARSTGRIKLTGDWTDPVDGGPGAPPPDTRDQAAEIGQVKIAYGDPDDIATGTSLVLDTNDTKAHDVAVRAEAFSRYSNYFTDRLTHSFSGTNPVTLNNPPVVPGEPGVVPKSVVCTLTDGTKVPRSDYTVDRDTGILTPVAGGALDGTPFVSIDYVPLPVSRTGATAPTVVVPASAPPGRPSVVEVLPAVSRQIRGGDSSGTIRIEHSGQVLRLLLQRPWWTSGRNERLAVVIDGDTDNTRIGRDPIFGTANGGLDQLATSDMWNRSVENGTFDGITVAGHDVIFDAARDLWIANIELRADLGYRPFVRPVICRLQGDAKAGAHLSERVVLDPHRLGVNRQVSIRPGAGAVKVSVTGPDNDGVGPPNNRQFNEITAVLQEKEAGVADPDLAWVDVSTSLVTLDRVERGDGWSNWNGKVQLPGPPANYRLVIEETEPSRREVTNFSVIARDTVYVETIELAGGAPA